MITRRSRLGLREPRTFEQWLELCQKSREAKILPLAQGNRDLWPMGNLSMELLGKIPRTARCGPAVPTGRRDSSRRIERTERVDLAAGPRVLRSAGRIEPGRRRFPGRHRCQGLFLSGKSAQHILGSWFLADIQDAQSRKRTQVRHRRLRRSQPRGRIQRHGGGVHGIPRQSQNEESESGDGVHRIVALEKVSERVCQTGQSLGASRRGGVHRRSARQADAGDPRGDLDHRATAGHGVPSRAGGGVLRSVREAARREGQPEAGRRSWSEESKTWRGRDCEPTWPDHFSSRRCCCCILVFLPSTQTLIDSFYAHQGTKRQLSARSIIAMLPPTEISPLARQQCGLPARDVVVRGGGGAGHGGPGEEHAIQPFSASRFSRHRCCRWWSSASCSGSCSRKASEFCQARRTKAARC